MVLVDVADLESYKLFRNPISNFYNALTLSYRAKISVRESLSNLKKLQFEYAIWLSDIIKFEVTKAIKNQTFPMKYAPLKSGKKTFWLETSFLLNNITVWWDSEERVCFIGVPDFVVYPGTNTRVSNVIKWNEFGHRVRNSSYVVPPRPLLVPLSKKIISENKILFKQFIQTVHPEFVEFLL